MKILRVLSIDWDYFIDCSEIIRAVNFPDGGREHSPAIGQIIWAGRYAAHPQSELLKVGVRQSELERVASAVSRCKWVVVERDHHQIIGHIQQHWQYGCNTAEITNIDYHHDCYPYKIAGEIHCGNWITFLKKAGWLDGKKTKWVTSHEKPDRIKQVEIVSMDKALEQSYDLVFVCLSPMWSPPHLDDVFIQYFGKYNTEIKSRWNKEIKSMIKQHADFYKEFKSMGGDKCISSHVAKTQKR